MTSTITSRNSSESLNISVYRFIKTNRPNEPIRSNNRVWNVELRLELFFSTELVTLSTCIREREREKKFYLE